MVIGQIGMKDSLFKTNSLIYLVSAVFLEDDTN